MLKMTFLFVLCCLINSPKGKDINFTVTQDKGKQKIKLEPLNVCHFCQKNTIKV